MSHSQRADAICRIRAPCTEAKNRFVTKNEQTTRMHKRARAGYGRFAAEIDNGANAAGAFGQQPRKGVREAALRHDRRRLRRSYRLVSHSCPSLFHSCACSCNREQTNLIVVRCVAIRQTLVATLRNNALR